MTEIGQILPSHVVAIFAYEGVQPIDISGPAQGFATANEEGAVPPYSVHVVGPEPGMVRTASGFGIAVEPCPLSSVGTLVIPGGPGVHTLGNDPTWLALMAGMAERSDRVCSVCTGAFLVAASGLLDGRRVVTHWRSCDLLTSDYPSIVVDPDPIFIEDGKYWTTAGVTAGIDLTLALIERDHGAALASRVARRLVVPMRRAGDQKQFSEMLALQSKDAAPFEALLRAVAADPTRDWSVPAMAAIVGQSARNFHRHFEAATQTTPARAVERIRAEIARTLLGTTELRVSEVATKSGWLLLGSGVVTGPSRHQAGDEGAEQGFAASTRIVHELEEAKMERQLVLRDAPVRAQPGAQQRPEAFHRVDVHLAEAVAVLVAGILATRVADRLVPIAPGWQAGVDAIFVRVDESARDNGGRDDRLDRGLLHVGQHAQHHLAAALDQAEDGRLVLLQRAASRRARQPTAPSRPPLLATAAGWPLCPATT